MRIIVDTKHNKEALGDLYGIFFEDLNHAADGGLYGELVQNRSFEFDPIDNKKYHALTAWETIEEDGHVSARVLTGGAVSEKNPHYLALDIQEEGSDVGIQNTGFNTGIPLRAGAVYDFTCYGKREQCLESPVKVSLRSAEGKIYEEQNLCFGLEWEKHTLTLTAPEDDFAGRLAITAEGRGKVYLDFVSLFPRDTYRGRKGGLRRDLAEMLEQLHPKFMRFPGGCLVHDGALDSQARDAQYRWKNSIGRPEERPARRNNWNYNQTLGLGYYEYFQLCEDIGAEPLPVVPAGYDPHHKRHAPLDKLAPFIEDVLDLIEFANGGIDTPWGGKRAELGHPEPFHLKYVGIGNEEVGAEFFERADILQEAVRRKYPEVKIINTAGPFAAGGEFDRGWENARKVKSDLVDEHYYMAPEWFVANHYRYDGYDRKGPKVFLGEYASWGNTWYHALLEASYMIGLERNAAVVGLACYAPLFANVDYVNWRPDMIWFDNHRVYGSANYYVQKLFMEHLGEYRLECKLSDAPAPVLLCGAEGGITGDILLSAYESHIAYSNIVFTDLETGAEERFADCDVDAEKNRIFLLHTQSSRYSLELDAVELSGYRGIRVIFGSRADKMGGQLEGEHSMEEVPSMEGADAMKGEHSMEGVHAMEEEDYIKERPNEFVWTLGGWQNQDNSLTERINGNGAELCQYAFSVERGRKYHLKLQVEGRKIRLWVDGKLYQDTESRLPMAEPIYVSAAVGKAEMEGENFKEIILKLVNIREQEQSVEILLDGYGRSGQSVFRDSGESDGRSVSPEEEESSTIDSCLVKQWQMAGYAPDAANSFEEPEKVVPVYSESRERFPVLQRKIPGCSVTVLKVCVPEKAEK